MDLRNKVAFVGKSIESIARHDDEDLAVREAALKLVEQKIAEERQAMADRVAARVAEAVGGPAQG